MKPIKVTAAIIKEKGKILIARRKQTKHLGGLWEFPGGKIEKGETPEECLSRELNEEFGIKVEVGEFILSNIHKYDRGTINLMAFHTNYLSGTFNLIDHDKIKWIDYNEISKFDFAPADIPIVKYLIFKREVE